MLAAILAAWWLWTDFRREIQAQREILLARGDSVLAAFAGGLRTHHRVGMWFPDTLDVALEETAASPGILGLAVFSTDGQRIARGGVFPDTASPESTAQWTQSGNLLLFRQADLQMGRGGPPRDGGGRRGWRARSGENTTEEGPSELESLMQQTLWLGVQLDGSDYRQTVRNSGIHFALSLGIAWIAIGFGVLVVSLALKQSRLASELRVALERQKRHEEMVALGAGLAHETKNPLGLIRGLAQSLLRKEKPESPVREEAQAIVDEVDRVVARINGFLTYSRPRDPETKPVPLGEMIPRVLDLFREEARAKGVTLKSETAPGSVVSADPDLLRQMLVNLLVNSLVACGEGHTIEVDVRPEESHETVCLTVRDTGEGIAPEDLSEVTRPYFTRRAGGTGLGLALVRQAAEAHGWILTIESVRGKGTAVHLCGLKKTHKSPSEHNISPSP